MYSNNSEALTLSSKGRIDGQVAERRVERRIVTYNNHAFRLSIDAVGALTYVFGL